MAACTHLDHVHVTELPESVDGCEDCLAIGSPWLHLRICLECGKVGCCDDSPNRHATKHGLACEHPLIRSLEPGEECPGATSTASAWSSPPCTGRRGSRRRRWARRSADAPGSKC